MSQIQYTAGGLDFKIIPVEAGQTSVGHATLQLGMGEFDLGGFVVHATGMVSADHLRDLAATFITAANQCEAEVLKALVIQAQEPPALEVPA